MVSSPFRVFFRSETGTFQHIHIHLDHYSSRSVDIIALGALGVCDGDHAFHEKAGRSQVGSVVFSLDKVFLPPSGRCRHASIRTLKERLVSLGAYWAFSFQPVLPSVCRPVVLLLESGTRARRLTQSPELGFRLLLFLSKNVFDFMPPSAMLSGCCCARVRKLLHLPTSDGAARPAFVRSR
jgi:hypothetical protein